MDVDTRPGQDSPATEAAKTWAWVAFGGLCFVATAFLLAVCTSWGIITCH